MAVETILPVFESGKILIHFELRWTPFPTLDSLSSGVLPPLMSIRLDTDASADIRHPNRQVLTFKNSLSVSGIIRTVGYRHPVYPTCRYLQSAGYRQVFQHKYEKY